MSNLFQYTGLNALPVDSINPGLIVNQKRTPLPSDWQNQQVGNFWLYTNPTNNTQSLWYLASLFGNQAKWVELSGGAGTVITLTGNLGGAVSPLAGNINVVGDGITILVTGNPGTHTLTISAIGTGVDETLTGNSGGAVGPTAGNINVVGTGVITVVGNPGTSTLTITPSGAIASSFPTDAGTATPAAGVLNVLGGTSGRDINTSGSGSTIHIDLKNAITLGDLSAIGAGSNALSATTGDINLASGNLKLTNTNTAGSSGEIQFGGITWISNFGTQNTFVGGISGNTTNTAQNATGIGYNSLTALTSGNYNTALGTNTLSLLTTATGCTGIGVSALAANVSAIDNTALGYQALLVLASGSGANTSIGRQTLSKLTTGSFNTIVGYLSAVNYTGSESNNIILGCANGTAAESRVMRLGNDATVAGTSSTAKTFISGIRGITTDANDAIAVLISSTGQLGTVSSSKRFKDNIEDMGDYSSDIYNLRPVIFTFKEEHDLQSGLIAEEVEEVMPRLVAHDDKGKPLSIKYHDIPALLLNELQKLNKRVADLEVKMNKCSKCRS